jgi:hypothetical protein
LILPLAFKSQIPNPKFQIPNPKSQIPTCGDGNSAGGETEFGEVRAVTGEVEAVPRSRVQGIVPSGFSAGYMACPLTGSPRSVWAGMSPHSPRPSSRRRRRSRRTRAPLVAAVVTSVSVLGALLVAIGIRTGGGPADFEARGHPAATARVPSTDDGSSDAAPRYPYSVVPGGVHTLARLRQVVSMDPVVASHYAAVAVSRARLTRVSKPRLAYVSYRIRDRIFWTKRRVPLQPGEAVVTDGVSEIRARCGNRISDRPMEPTSPDEPPIAELERVLAPPVPAELPDVAEFDAALPPPPQGAVVLPPSDPGMARSIDVGGPLGLRVPDRRSIARDEDPDPPGGPPPSVPEPVSILLVGTGLIARALWGWRHRRRGH